MANTINIVKLINKNAEIIGYPATITSAVVDLDRNKLLSDLIKENEEYINQLAVNIGLTFDAVYRLLELINYTEDVTLLKKDLRLFMKGIHDYSQDYFTIVALEEGTLNFKLFNNNVAYYSKNNGAWTEGNSVEVVAGDKVRWKGEMTPLEQDHSGGIGTFGSGENANLEDIVTTIKFKAYGNTMSLLYGDDFSDKTTLIGTFTFNCLFRRTLITEAHNLILPATTLTDSCYWKMFRECSELISMPDLPATTVAANCYAIMFNLCSKLSINTPEILPAVEVFENSYNQMFSGCTALTLAPELPATTLGNYCYYRMFGDCVNLANAPELPALELATGCYLYLFYNCANINYIKALFINHVTGNTANWVSGVASSGTFVKNSTATWNTVGISGVPTGWTVGIYPITPPTITINESGVVMSADSRCSIYYTTDGSTPTTSSTLYTETLALPLVATNYKAIAVYALDFVSDVQESSVPYGLLPLTFEAIESGTFTLTIGQNVSTSSLTDVSYSVDNGETWVTTNNVDDTEVIITTSTINANDKVLWKGSGITMSEVYSNSTSSSITSIFTSTGTFNAEGNIMSLLNGDNFKENSEFDEYESGNFALLFYQNSQIVSAENLVLPADEVKPYSYYRMFQDCTSLTTAPELPATTLAKSCCQNMFSGCTSLTSTPELPATTLANYCYGNMFSGCTGLTTALELPAIILATNCYSSMFNGCTSLATAPELPATTLAESCYQQMFYGCTSLTTVPELPATTLANSCYDSMFYGCTSLTAAPQLPATALTQYCYSTMFKGCTSLTSTPELPATTLANSCYANMFQDCTSLTTAPELPATTLLNYCYRGMFSGCTSLTAAPQLPAIILLNYCYSNMFYGCTSLTAAPQLPATTLTNNCYANMFQDCTSLTSTPELPATTLASYCYQGMFSDCTNLTTAPELPVTALATFCYQNMFYGCTSLTTAPELPATTLTNNCYDSMFYGCTNLAYIKAMFTTTPSTRYTKNWVRGVASNGTFVKNSAATWDVTGTYGVPSGWTVELLSTTS